MNLFARTILHYRCNHTRIVLRLFKRTHYTAWTPNTFQRLREESRYFLPCCTYQTVADGERKMYNFSGIEVHEPEHKYVHSMLLNSSHYKNSILPPVTRIQEVSSDELQNLYTTNWSIQNMQAVYRAIKKLAYCHLNGSQFEISLYEQILRATIPKLPNFNDYMLKSLMQYLIVLVDETHKTAVCKDLLSALSKECSRRFMNGNINETLLICDAFYQLKGIGCNYVWRAMRKMCTKVHKLTSKNLVQVCFLLRTCKPNSFVNMFELECQLQECISELSGNEIGIIAGSYFMNKKKVRSRTLMSKMIKAVIPFLDTMDSISLASFMKLIRYTDCVSCVSIFTELLVHLRAKVPDLSLKCLMHIMHACASMRVYDQVLIDKILERIVKEVKFMRLKDIERIIYAISAVTPFTKYYIDVCHELANEVMLTYKTDRASEVDRYASSLMCIGMHLAIQNIYIPELVQHIFDPAFVEKIYNNNLKLLTNDILYYHYYVKIDMPDYKGPFLKESLCRYLTKQHSFNEDTFRKDKILTVRTEVVFLCKNSLGIEPYVDCILPHSNQRYIVVGLDENGKSIDVEPILSEMPSGTIKYVNSDELKKIKWKILFIIPLLARIRGYDGVHGNMRKNIQQLMTLGYTPVVICEKEWESFTEEEKVNYLDQSIFQDSKHKLLEILFP